MRGNGPLTADAPPAQAVGAAPRRSQSGSSETKSEPCGHVVEARRFTRGDISWPILEYWLRRGNGGRRPRVKTILAPQFLGIEKGAMNQSKDVNANAVLGRVAADLLDVLRRRAEQIGQATAAAKDSRHCSAEQAAWLDLQADIALTELRWVRNRILERQSRSGDLSGS